MKKTLIAAAVMATSGIAFAASNVTLYGVIEEGVLLEKAKHADTTVQLRSGFDQAGVSRALKTSETDIPSVSSLNRASLQTTATSLTQAMAQLAASPVKLSCMSTATSVSSALAVQAL